MESEAISSSRLRLACHHLVNAKRELVDDFSGNDRALWWRDVYMNRAAFLILKSLAILNLGYVVLDDLYMCDVVAFAEACEINHVSHAIRFIELLITIGLGLGVFVQYQYKRWQKFVRNRWLVFVSCVAILEVLVSCIENFVHAAGTSDRTHTQWLWFVRALLRPVFVLHHLPYARIQMFCIMKVVPKVGVVLLVNAVFLLLFSFFARILLLDPDFPGNDFLIEGNGFSSFYASLATMFWWATGNNGPEPGQQVGRPGFKGGVFWGFFFVFYTCFQVFYLLQIVTATAYDAYSALSANVREERAVLVESEVEAAFSAVSTLQGGAPAVSCATLDKVQVLLGQYGIKAQTVASGTGETRYGFESFKEAVMSATDTRDADHERERCSKGTFRWNLRAVVSSRHWVFLLRLLGVTNIVLLCLDAEHAVSNSSLKISGYISAGILLVYSIDFASIIVGYGLVDVFGAKNGRVLGRFLIHLFCVCMFLQHMLANSWRSTTLVTGMYVVLSTAFVHVVEILSFIPEFNATIVVMVRVIPRLGNLFVASFCIMYSWSVVGVMISGGSFTRRNASVLAFNAGDNGPAFYTCNFNTVSIGIYTLFFSVYGNNIQNFTGGLHAAGGTLALVHFMLFYLFGIFVLGNIVVSILIEAHQDAKIEISVKAKRIHPETSTRLKQEQS